MNLTLSPCASREKRVVSLWEKIFIINELPDFGDAEFLRTDKSAQAIGGRVGRGEAFGQIFRAFCKDSAPNASPLQIARSAA
jgi:hypothetical protein